MSIFDAGISIDRLNQFREVEVVNPTNGKIVNVLCLEHDGKTWIRLKDLELFGMTFSFWTMETVSKKLSNERIPVRSPFLKEKAEFVSFAWLREYVLLELEQHKKIVLKITLGMDALCKKIYGADITEDAE